MSRHTDGPWRYGYNAVTDRCAIASDTPETVIARDVDPKDAAVIAAAPDMLVALKVCVGHDEARFMPGYHAAKDAIAKAEGKQ